MFQLFVSRPVSGSDCHDFNSSPIYFVSSYFNSVRSNETKSIRNKNNNFSYFWKEKKQVKISRKKKDDGFFTKHSRARLILLNQGMLGEGGTMSGIRRHERHTDAVTG